MSAVPWSPRSPRTPHPSTPNFPPRPPRRSTLHWPTSPLDAADRAFTLLIQPPTPLAFDGRTFPGLPRRLLPLDELRSVLLDPATPTRVLQAVWGEVVTRAQRDGPAWVVATVGLALPGLRRAAGWLTTGYRGETSDIDAELLTGFLTRLRGIDPDTPRIWWRLINAGLHTARRFRDANADTHLVRSHPVGSIAPVRPWDHPELLLARAVAIAVLDAEEANLIAATRLDTLTLAQAATGLGISASAAGARRRHAEDRLVEAIRSGELGFVTLQPRRRRSPQPATVGWVLGSAPTVGVVLGTQPRAVGGTAPVTPRVTTAGPCRDQAPTVVGGSCSPPTNPCREGARSPGGPGPGTGIPPPVNPSRDRGTGGTHP